MNHKQRRDMEKKLGLLAEYKKMNREQQAEVRKRKREAGEQIHLRNLQENENRRLAAEAEAYARQIQSFMETGKTYEEAEAIVKKNREIQEARELKKAQKRAKSIELAVEKNKKN